MTQPRTAESLRDTDSLVLRGSASFAEQSVILRGDRLTPVAGQEGFKTLAAIELLRNRTEPSANAALKPLLW